LVDVTFVKFWRPWCRTVKGLDLIADGAREKHAVEFWLASPSHTLYHEMLAAEVSLHNEFALFNIAEEHVRIIIDSAASSRPSSLHVPRAFQRLTAA